MYEMSLLATLLRIQRVHDPLLAVGIEGAAAMVDTRGLPSAPAELRRHLYPSSAVTGGRTLGQSGEYFAYGQPFLLFDLSPIWWDPQEQTVSYKRHRRFLYHREIQVFTC